MINHLLKINFLHASVHNYIEEDHVRKLVFLLLVIQCLFRKLQTNDFKFSQHLMKQTCSLMKLSVCTVAELLHMYPIKELNAQVTLDQFLFLS